MTECRDGSGSLISKYFDHGQSNSGVNLFYSIDHLGSVREQADGSGNITAALSYDPYGRRRVSQGTVTSDFAYGGYYLHSASGLYLTPTRAFNSNLGSWLSRDPLEEEAGSNLFAYSGNSPINMNDPSGLNPATGVLTGINPATGLTIILGGPEISQAMARIFANTEVLWTTDPAARGNSLRSNIWAYVYVIYACPGTPSPYGPIGKSGIYKYGMGEWDPTYSRFNSQLNALRGAYGRRYTGNVMMLFRDRISARIYEASLIISTKAQFGAGDPVGNRTPF